MATHRPAPETLRRLCRLRDSFAERLERERSFSMTTLMVNVDGLTDQACPAPCDQVAAFSGRETHEHLMVLSLRGHQASRRGPCPRHRCRDDLGGRRNAS